MPSFVLGILLILLIIAYLWLLTNLARGIEDPKDLGKDFKKTPEDFWREGAKARGFTNVKEYKKVLHEEWMKKWSQEMIRIWCLTREEVEFLEIEPGTPILFLYQDMEAKRQGLTFLEVRAKFDDLLMDNIGEECYEIDFTEAEYLMEDLLKKRSLPDEARNHLNHCEDCNVRFLMAEMRLPKIDDYEIRILAGIQSAPEIRAERLRITVEELDKRDKERNILVFGGDDCFTMSERIQYARTLELPPERMSHTNTCPPCQRMIMADREDFRQTGKIGGLAMKALKEQDKSKQS